MISLIVPLYNRPQEIRELLESLNAQSQQEDCELLIVEDGSEISSESIVRNFSSKIPIHYFFQENAGPSAARNTGAANANGAYLIFLDSDVVLPSGYLASVQQAIAMPSMDGFGGPDAASEDFSPIQKAINYSMTSFLTTGGIRGAKKSLDQYLPRSFNMGIRKQAFDAVGGFQTSLRFGEDLDLSLRLKAAGYQLNYLPEAMVYHKRRSSFQAFFKQIFNSGIARIHLSYRHPGTLKLMHFAPGLYVIFSLLSWLSLGLGLDLWAMPWLGLQALILLDASLRTQFSLAPFCWLASQVQLISYGLGFWWAMIKRTTGSAEFKAFDRNFYQ